MRRSGARMHSISSFSQDPHLLPRRHRTITGQDPRHRAIGRLAPARPCSGNFARSLGPGRHARGARWRRFAGARASISAATLVSGRGRDRCATRRSRSRSACGPRDQAGLRQRRLGGGGRLRHAPGGAAASSRGPSCENTLQDPHPLVRDRPHDQGARLSAWARPAPHGARSRSVGSGRGRTDCGSLMGDGGGFEVAQLGARDLPRRRCRAGFRPPLEPCGRGRSDSGAAAHPPGTHAGRVDRHPMAGRHAAGRPAPSGSARAGRHPSWRRAGTVPRASARNPELVSYRGVVR